MEGAFSYDKKIAFVRIKLYGIKVVTLKFFFDEKNGVYLSVNGREGHPFPKKKKEKKKKMDYKSIINALYFTNADVGIYAGGSPESTSLILAAIRLIIGEILAAAKASGRLDFYRLRVFPCYVGEPISVKFSISLFTAPVLILQALAHTTNGVKYAKRSNRKFNG